MDDDTLEALMDQLGISPAWRQFENQRPERPMPRQMRPAAQRASDPQLGPQERRRAYEQVQREQSLPRPVEAYQAPRNQFAEAGEFGLELTGLPSIRRSAAAFADNRPREGFEEGALGALGVATLGVGPRAARPAPRTAPPMRAPTRVYRGLNQEHDPARAAALGDRWWHTNPEVASSYAPGGEGAHVTPGILDEGALRMARIDAPPGTMWRAIPAESLPPDIRRAFPRSTTAVTTHEAAAAAEAAGYDGVSFGGVRDSGFAGRMEGAYPGFGTGDDGRVVAVFRDDAVGSPFPTEPAPSGALRPPPRQLGTASDGSVMPVRPPEPFRQSMVGGSDDLADAARMRPQSASPDGGGGGQPLERLAMTPEREAQLRARTQDLSDDTPLDLRLRIDTARQRQAAEQAIDGIETWPPERVAAFYRALERMDPIAAERMFEALSRRGADVRFDELRQRPPQ